MLPIDAMDRTSICDQDMYLSKHSNLSINNLHSDYRSHISSIPWNTSVPMSRCAEGPRCISFLETHVNRVPNERE